VRFTLDPSAPPGHPAPATIADITLRTRNASVSRTGPTWQFHQVKRPPHARRTGPGHPVGAALWSKFAAQDATSSARPAHDWTPHEPRQAHAQNPRKAPVQSKRCTRVCEDEAARKARLHGHEHGPLSLGSPPYSSSAAGGIGSPAPGADWPGGYRTSREIRPSKAITTLPDGSNWSSPCH